MQNNDTEEALLKYRRLERKIESQTSRQTKRQGEKVGKAKRERERERETERRREREIDRQRVRERVQERRREIGTEGERDRERQREKESFLFFQTTYKERILIDFNQDCLNGIYNDFTELIQKYPEGIVTDIDLHESSYEWQDK